jgi:hypothetical protein
MVYLLLYIPSTYQLMGNPETTINPYFAARQNIDHPALLRQGMRVVKLCNNLDNHSRRRKTHPGEK